MERVLAAFAPNRTVSRGTVRLIIAAQLVFLVAIWTVSPFPLLPKPTEVLGALSDLWAQGLGQELVTSLFLNLEAIGLATLISLALAYATVLPAMRPVVIALSKLRFLSMVGLTFFFTIMTRGAHSLKLALLVFSVSVFFVTGMADVIAQVPKEKFDLARTLRMGEWRVVWEVIVLGQADKAFDVLRQNAAIGWMMLTMVEGMARSEGGIGAMLLNENKHFKLDAVFAIQLTILVLGLGQDYLIGLFKNLTCPYARLTLERS